MLCKHFYYIGVEVLVLNTALAAHFSHNFLAQHKFDANIFLWWISYCKKSLVNNNTIVLTCAKFGSNNLYILDDNKIIFSYDIS